MDHMRVRYAHELDCLLSCAGESEERIMDEDERKVMNWIEKEYPEHKATKACDEGDVLIFYLRYNGEKYNNYGRRDLVVYYNTWYPGEYTIHRLDHE